MYGHVRLFHGTVRSGTVFSRSFTVGYGPVWSFHGRLRFETVRYGSIRKRYFMHAAAVLIYGLMLIDHVGV